LRVCNVFRRDNTNVGDWYCPPNRYFAFTNVVEADILTFDPGLLDGNVLVGGGGLLAQTFHPHMRRLVEQKPKMRSLVAWGIGQSENIDRGGGIVARYTGKLPDYLDAFDIVGLRDFDTPFQWVPCSSCMLQQLDRNYEIEHEICIYEHKRIPIALEGFPRMSNNGDDIDRAIQFLASAHVVVTNSYLGAYWAILLGRRVLCIPNMSKVYGLKHQPVFCRAENWKRLVELAQPYPNALAECRAANAKFYRTIANHYVAAA
jgi:hypothetical protein